MHARVMIAALAGWAVLLVSELIVVFGLLRLLALVLSADLLPSLKIVLDMAILATSGWVAGRIGRARTMAAAGVTAAGLCLFDLTPYLLLNVPWLLKLTVNAVSDSRFLSSLLTTLTMHALLFGSLFIGARFSRPRQAPVGLGMHR